MNKMEKICSGVLRKMVMAERDSLLPSCVAVLYQPERPVCRNKEKEPESDTCTDARYPEWSLDHF